ncbi:30S ribosomal protein S6 [Candidatus Gottesmanbacteria bacterium]|nr:30S ribosomal protein S6 [Candidatus Gottesmanbacteria bacterium]
MRNYELTVILEKEETKALADLLAKNGAEVIKKNDPVKRDLAYAIKKKKQGYYVHFELKIKPEEVAGLDQKLKLQENIIRHLLVQS